MPSEVKSGGIFYAQAAFARELLAEIKHVANIVFCTTQKTQ